MRLTNMGDGTGRIPRPIQSRILADIADSGLRRPITAIEAPTGIGKTWLIRTLQRALNAPILTSSNYELQKYVDTYNLTSLMGASNYKTDREYSWARNDANSQSVYNYLSYFYSQQRHGTVIIDEAHNLEDTLVNIASSRIVLGYGNYRDILGDDVKILQTIRSILDSLTVKARDDVAFWKKYINYIDRLYFLLDDLTENLHRYIINIETRMTRGRLRSELVITPCVPPYHLLRKLTRASKIILFSGTLTKRYLLTLIPEQDLTYFSYNSPSSIDRRVIYFYPNTSKNKSHFETLEKLKRIRKLGNTLMHSSYKDLRIYREHYKDATYPTSNTFKSKKIAIDRFKTIGGVMIAAGMSEGVDLPGDYCTNVIVPSIQYFNMGDPYIKKRKSLSDGQDWYNERALMILRQELGRGHRGGTDFCRNWIFCPTFARLIKNTKPPRDFLECIEWSTSVTERVLNG